VQHLFNPYTGADLGDAMSPGLRVIQWLVDFHDNLLAAKTGRFINGIFAILVTVLTLAGAVVWWPGIKNWRRGITIDWKAKFVRFNWDLHSALGFWCFLFMLMWGVSGIYLSFPGPFGNFFNLIDPNDNFTDSFLSWFTLVHVGRFGWRMEALWTVLGLVPAVLFVTGALMWWNRVIRHGVRQSAAVEKE
jgi:uncharacterized iron-regulated membrane protein